MVVEIRWLIGDGSSMDVFCDACLFDLPLGRWLMVVSMQAGMSMLVRRLFMIGKRRWDTDRVTNLFGKYLVVHVLSLAIHI